jgi:hypothetical protein
MYIIKTIKITSESIKDLLSISIEDYYKERNLNIKYINDYDQEFYVFQRIWIFLDCFYYYKKQRQELINEEPVLTGDIRYDTFLAALAEHFAYHFKLKMPKWVSEANRFLKEIWFPKHCQITNSMAIIQSAASFKRRGIFIENSFFERV